MTFGIQSCLDQSDIRNTQKPSNYATELKSKDGEATGTKSLSDARNGLNKIR